MGGGIGRNTLQFVKTFPHLRYIVQDQEATITEGKKVGTGLTVEQTSIDTRVKFWTVQVPDALTSGKVEMQGVCISSMGVSAATDKSFPAVHNFFESQPVKNPAVFFMACILHDWPDEVCVAILDHLRASAGPETQLVIADTIIPYACKEPGIQADDVRRITMPAPLLPNGGHWGIHQYILDLTVSRGH